MPLPGGAAKAQRTAEPHSANDLRHGNPGERAAIYYGRGGQKRRSGRIAQGQNKDSLSRQAPAKETAPLYLGAENTVGSRFRHPHGQTYEPHQHLAGDERLMRGSRRQSAKGVSPQSAPPVCEGVLRNGKGHCKVGRHSRSQQYQHDENLHNLHRL